ncbi:MAG: hypothetical protein KBT48_05125 [Firmicutes bacterium]|nr:hypothetical protein [Bacillota bacterium]
MNQKLVKAFMAGLLACGMVGCASQPAQQEEVQEEGTAHAGMANPNVYDVSEDEMTQKTGISLPMPKEASDVKYNIIGETEEHPIAEVEFTLNGKKMYLRAQSTQLLPANPSASQEELEKYNISGLNYEWDTTQQEKVKYCEGFIFVNTKEGAGYIMWEDVVPGILYNLGMEKGADAQTLIETANQVFVSAQGDN